MISKWGVKKTVTKSTSSTNSSNPNTQNTEKEKKDENNKNQESQENEIPDYAEEAVFLQTTLLELNEQNYEEIASLLYMNYSDGKDEDLDKIASNVFTIARVRPKLQKQYAQLMNLFSLLVGKQFNVDTLLSAPPWFLRHLYLQGLVDLVKIKERIEERQYYLRFFVPELGYNESTFSKQFSIYNSKINELKENDWQKYKEILEYGYTKDSVGYIIKYDDVESLKKIDINKVPSASLSPIESINFDENMFPNRINNQFEEQFTNIPLVTFAAHYGSEKCFEYLKSKQTLNPITAAHAFYGGNLNIVKTCANQIANMSNCLITAILGLHNDLYDYMKGKPFTQPQTAWPARCGNVVYLLKSFKDQDLDDQNINSKIMAAAELGNYGCVEILYHMGYSLEGGSGSPLERASACGHIPIVRLLLKYDPQPFHSPRQMQILQYAGDKNQTAIIKLLMKHGLRCSPNSSELKPFVAKRIFPNSKIDTNNTASVRNRPSPGGGIFRKPF